MLGSLLFAAAFCVVALLVYVARYSSRVRAERTRLIQAPLERVVAQVADLQRWGAWCTWLADSVSSHQTHREGHRITQRLRLQQPFAVQARSDWQFRAHDGATEVRWSLRGRVGFSVRAFSRTIQESLALDMRYNLDRLAQSLESADAPRYAIQHLGVRDVDACRMAYQTYDGPIAGLPQAVAQITAALQQRLGALGLTAVGAPMAVYAKTNVKLRSTVCHIGLPIGPADTGALLVRELPAHRAYTVQLAGDRSALELAWYLGMQRMVAEHIQPDQRIMPCERYLASPPDAELTELQLPVLASRDGRRVGPKV